MKLDWYLARRYLSSRRGGRLLSFITWIALGGVIVGVTALVIVIGVMTGMQEDLRDKILESNPHVLILQQGPSLRMTDWETVLETVKEVDGVRAASPFVIGSGVTVQRAGYAQPAVLYGVPTEKDGVGATDLEEKILEGLYDLSPPASGLSPLLLGSYLASNMQVFPGDTLVLMSIENQSMSSFGAMMPQMRQFEVTGTFTTGMYEADTKNAYTSLGDAQRFLGYDAENHVSGLSLRVDDVEEATVVADAIFERLGLPYQVRSWKETNSALFSALKLEKLAMFIILSLIVVVAAFNIVSTLIMVVSNRTREIGILKSMGMTDEGILRAFVLQGAWIGVVGTVVGTTLGLIICWLIDTYEIIPIPPEVYFVDRLPVQLHLTDIATIVGASILISFAATIYPSLQASRLNPVEAIRSE